MQTLTSIKDRGQESLNQLIELGKQQPEEVRTWGLTAGAAVAGALTLAAVAKGILAIIATLANPPVALSAGALAGGALGWSFMQKQQSSTATTADVMPLATTDTVADTVATVEAAPLATPDTVAETVAAVEAAPLATPDTIAEAIAAVEAAPLATPDTVATPMVTVDNPDPSTNDAV